MAETHRHVLKADKDRAGCPFCDAGEHHKSLLPAELPLADETIADAIYHSLTAAAIVLVEHGVPQDRWMDVLGPVAEAQGWIMHAAERVGQRRGVADFIEQLVLRYGYGVYRFEIGPDSMGDIEPTRTDH